MMSCGARRILTVFIIALLILAASCGEDKMEDNSAYVLAASVAELTGKLETCRVREAPGPHESQAKDKIARIHVLELDAPVVFTANDGSTIEAKEIQITDCKGPMLRFEGKRVSIKGKYYKGHDYSHHTDVVAEADAMTGL